MKVLSHEKYDELKHCVLSAIPGWRFVQKPKGFGWAPDRHFRAIVSDGIKQQRIVIRQCWTDKGYEIERYLYHSVLSDLIVRTPELIGTFSLNPEESKWMILEDLGEGQPDMNCVSDREIFLETLGYLHGQGLGLVQEKSLSDSPLSVFHASDSEIQGWRNDLMTALTSRSYSIEQWVIDLLDELEFRLSKEPPTLLHGDTDASNAILIDTKMALVDWEKSRIGPPSLDLGRIMEKVESTEELESYRAAFCSLSGRELSKDNMRYIANLGVGYNSLRWICYYIKQSLLGSPPKWSKGTYEGFLEQLCLASERFVR